VEMQEFSEPPEGSIKQDIVYPKKEQISIFDKIKAFFRGLIIFKTIKSLRTNKLIWFYCYFSRQLLGL
jgi:hypothetical protein